MAQESHGLELTAANPEAADLCDRMIRSYLGFRLETGDLLKQTFAADPDMPMAHIVRGYFFHLFSIPPLERKARESSASAEAAIAKVGANERELLHLAALKAWNVGDLTGATEQWERILLEWPRDVMALRLSHFSHFYLTGAQAMRDSVERIMYAWTPEVPDYGFVQGVRSFAHEEAGDYSAAEKAGRDAVERNPADIWAVHAVAHVMEMQGRHRDGIAWLEGLSPNWEGANNFRFHTWWHKALYHLELGQLDAVLALYDDHIRKDHTEEYLDVTNGTAMLWRLEGLGVDVGDRWQELAEICERHARDSLLVFADAHYMMALAATGREEAAQELMQAMRQAAEGAGDQADVARKVGLPVCEATLALRRGEPHHALDILMPLRDEIWRLGGSHAQRDIWQQMLIEAAKRSGNLDIARLLLAQRTSAKPNSPTSWHAYAGVLERLGDTAGATRAREREQAALRL